MKKFIKILHGLSILMFLSSVMLILINAFSQNNTILLSAGILIIVAFVFSLIQVVISLIIKIKITLYSKYMFLTLLFFSIIIISIITKVEFLQYFAIIPFIPGYLIGFYLEHEDEIKQKMKIKIKNKSGYFMP